jgi:hypothetical protein
LEKKNRILKLKKTVMEKKLEITVEDKNTGLLVIDILMWETLDELREEVKTLQDKCMLIMEKGYWHCDEQTLTEEEHQIIYY